MKKSYHLPDSIKPVKLMNWLLLIEQLRLFYNELFKYGKVRCTFEDFACHFIYSRLQMNKIVWLGSNAELPYLITRLMELKIISPTKRVHSLICQNFTDKNGFPLKPNCLHVSKCRHLGTKSADIIDAIIETVLID